MRDLKFSYNWNKKLDCKAFTTIRLSDKYKIGDECQILLQVGKNKIAEIKGVAVILDIREFALDSLNSFIAHIDTGYSVDECRKIIMRMYPDADWSTQKLKLILLKYK